MNDLKSWLDIAGKDKDADLLLKELIKIEMIATTVHYAEVFAASLLGMLKYRRFHKYLLKYSPKEISSFYSRVSSRRLPYIMKLLQYPPLEQVSQDEIREQLSYSATQAHAKIKELAQFYIKWHEFYNTYKHGMRLFPGKPNPEQDFTVIGYFRKNQSLDSFVAIRADTEAETAWSLCAFMHEILKNAESVFAHGTLLKEEQFELRLFASKKNNEELLTKTH